MAKNNRKGPGSPQNREKEREARAHKAQAKRRKRFLKAGAVVAFALLVIGATVTVIERQEERLHDLTAVGRGTPAVVQVHDINCPVCNELRATVDSISSDYDSEGLLIRVADVHSEAGLAFAARYTDARRATLLFIDGGGELVDVRSGHHDADTLRALFDRHAGGNL